MFHCGDAVHGKTCMHAVQITWLYLIVLWFLHTMVHEDVVHWITLETACVSFGLRYIHIRNVNSYKCHLAPVLL